jgi:hypothetical protein
MPYETGTVNSHRALLDRIRDYVSDEEIMGAEKWEIMRDTPAELILRGPGESGQDQIFVGARIFESSPNPEYYNLLLNGFVGYDPKLAFMDQPGGIPEDFQPQIPLVKNSQIKYWLVASGRRIIVIAKIGTQYEAGYLGFIQPYGLDGQYPYPLAVGGSLVGQYATSGGSANDYRYTQRYTDHRHFCDPGCGTSAVNFNSTLRIRRIDGKWAVFQNYSGGYSGTSYSGDVLRTNSGYVVWPGICGKSESMLQAMDGTYHLFPFMLVEKTDNNCIGQFDGCYWVTGRGLAPEDILTIGDDTYLAVPNVWRTGAGDFWALRLS